MDQARRIRTAVVGVGHFGRRHAAKLAALPAGELVAVADVDGARAREAAAEHGVAAVTDYRELAGRVDAVSVVTPTAAHFEIAAFFLEAGVHVLVEKPVTRTLAEADGLIDLARERGLVLQVGHQERFFAREIGLEKLAYRPLYIEAHRIAPFQPRGTDVSVVLDLMIHDIDLIAALADAPVTEVDAVGAPVLSAEADIVNTRLKFANGCVASVVASRIAERSERMLRIFQPDSMISVDLMARRVKTVRRAPEAAASGGDGEGDGFQRDERVYADGDPLATELAAFVDAAATDRAPLVTGEDGRRALDTALRIGESLEAHLARVRADAPAAPAAPAPDGERAGSR